MMRVISLSRTGLVAVFKRYEQLRSEMDVDAYIDVRMYCLRPEGLGF
jgi:hypothetical protein